MKNCTARQRLYARKCVKKSPPVHSATLYHPILNCPSPGGFKKCSAPVQYSSFRLAPGPSRPCLLGSHLKSSQDTILASY